MSTISGKYLLINTDGNPFFFNTKKELVENVKNICTLEEAYQIQVFGIKKGKIERLRAVLRLTELKKKKR